jgi:uncharacterized protein (DUF1697 family)
MPTTRMLALLRGVNVGGHRKVPMAALREVAAAIGLTDVSTYIASGNLVFSSTLKPATVAGRLAAAIHERFGFPVDLVVVTRAQWEAAVAGCPFAAAAAARPNALHLAVCPGKPAKGALAALTPLCQGGEAVAVVGDVLWVDYAAGVARSKLTPVALDRAMGSPVTARNVRTATQLLSMLAGG